VVGFTPRPLYPHEKNPRYPLDRRLGGPQSRSGHSGEDKIPSPAGNRTLEKVREFSLTRSLARSLTHSLTHSLTPIKIVIAPTSHHDQLHGLDPTDPLRLLNLVRPSFHWSFKISAPCVFCVSDMYAYTTV
jgi:hypothetical protein